MTAIRYGLQLRRECGALWLCSPRGLAAPFARPSYKEGQPLPPANWRYGYALFFGALLGVLAFLLQQFVQPAALREQFQVLMLFLAGGALLGCAAVALRNRAARRAYLDEERRRGFAVARRPRND